MYRPELERRLAEAERQSAALHAEADAAESDLHPACISDDEPAAAAPAPGAPTLDPSPARGGGKGGGRAEAAASDLHSACISDPGADPASLLPTPRRRAVNRLRAQRADDRVRAQRAAAASRPSTGNEGG
jgi:hypothetical protein